MVKKEKQMSSSEWVSEAAVKTAASCLRHFYPKETADLAQSLLTAAAPHFEGVKRGTSRKAVILPDQAVEEAAKSIYRTESSNNWDDMEDRLKQMYRDDARLALDAVSLQLQ